jgi:hypothetical protein
MNTHTESELSAASSDELKTSQLSIEFQKVVAAVRDHEARAQEEEEKLYENDRIDVPLDMDVDENQNINALVGVDEEPKASEAPSNSEERHEE